MDPERGGGRGGAGRAAGRRGRGRGRGREQPEEPAPQIQIEIPPLPVARHPWYDFPEDLPAETRARYVTHLARYLNKKIDVPHYFDWGLLERVGLAGPLKGLLSVTYRDEPGEFIFVDRGWSRLLALREPVYRELCMEFFSTIHFTTTAPDTAADAITFRLGGQARSMSLVEFSRRIGIYTLAETRDTHFLPFLRRAFRHEPPAFRASDFWPTIATGVYTPAHALESLFRRPIHRLLHRLLSTTITHRHGSEKVSGTDLFLMWSIITPGVWCHIPAILAHFLSHLAKGKLPQSPLCGGQFITCLARSFDILTPEREEELSRSAPTPFTEHRIAGMRIIEITDGGVVRAGPTDDVDPEEEIEEDVEERVRPRQRRRIVPPVPTSEQDLRTLVQTIEGRQRVMEARQIAMQEQLAWMTATLTSFFESQHFTPPAPCPGPYTGRFDHEAGPSGSAPGAAETPSDSEPPSDPESD